MPREPVQAALLIGQDALVERIRSWPAVAPMAAGGAAFVIVGVASLSSGAGAPVLYALVSLLGCWLTWFAFRAGLVVRDDGVEVRTGLRTRFIPWEEVDCFFVAQASWAVLHLRTVSGQELAINGVASFGRLGPSLDDICDRLNSMRRT